MDRRSFLTLLGAASVSVVVPEIWTPPPGLLPSVESITQMTRVSPPADSIFDIILCGKNNCSEVATFNVIRPDGEKLLAIALNTFGGVFRWVAAPGEEIPVPVTFEYHGNMTVNVVGRRGDQMSFTVLEPGNESPALIPVHYDWQPRLAAVTAVAKPSVPDIFRKAFDA